MVGCGDAANYIMAITGSGCARHTVHYIIKLCHISYYVDGQ